METSPPASGEPERTYTPEEVCEKFLTLEKPGGLRKAAQRGRIPHHRTLGNRIVFTAGDIDAITNARAFTPGQVSAESAPQPTPAPAPARTPRTGGRRTAAAPAQDQPITPRQGGPRRLKSVPGSA
ncbi:hypothetical protein [Streptomonospora litoralis]|uniref:Uncharacterized protein n=1 Tax=Streptomonospora litoralis TaxID=2498135 RepID=A0A4P6QAS9_9ACTN|nr:hypothetical protein [Streptomonospora litoralis]QBI56881.1 hypothetical protein EKD16_25705 [Streptomonospora litoralis]